MKKWLYIILALSVYSCCIGGITTTDNGPLPESALRFAPYLNDSMYSFQHSDGLVINFETSRETQEEWSHCADCCYEYVFETNTTIMLPDSPVFDIHIAIDNYDTANITCEVSIGKYGFVVPTYESQYPYFEMFDSLLIDSISYYDVFKLGPPQKPFSNEDPIQVDSLYYNYEYGILKILMSNGEYYQILQ